MSDTKFVISELDPEKVRDAIAALMQIQLITARLLLSDKQKMEMLKQLSEIVDNSSHPTYAQTLWLYRAALESGGDVRRLPLAAL